MSIYNKVSKLMENAIQNTFNKIVDEKLSCDDGAGEWIKDFQKSKDPKFKGKSKEKRKDMALGAYYGKCNEGGNFARAQAAWDNMVPPEYYDVDDDNDEHEHNMEFLETCITGKDSEYFVDLWYCTECDYDEFRNKRLRSDVTEGIDEDPLYVEYSGPITGETPFEMGDGEKYEYCWAIYPNGKKDIGVYKYKGDVCVAYDVFRRWYNIK